MLLIILTIIPFLVKSEKPCPIDWEHIPQLDACFLSPTQPGDWDEAEEFCNEMDGNLVSVSTDEEAQIIREIFARENPSFFNWIGFRWNSEADNFTWTDHRPVEFTKFYEEPFSAEISKNHRFNRTGDCVAWVFEEENDIDGWQSISCQYSQFYMCRKQVNEQRSTIWHLNDEGIIASSEYPDPYQNDDYETHIIKTNPGNRILLQFDFIDTEKNVDFITVTEGFSTQDAALARLSGFYRNISIVSNFEQLLINFESDSDVTGDGFLLKYKILHPLPTKVFSNSYGSVTSNNYPKSPDSFLIQNYLITCDSKHHIVLQMKELNIDLYDRIKMYNGDSFLAEKLQIFHQTTNIRDSIKSTKNSVFFTYSTKEQKKADNHWRLEYNCISDGNLGDEIVI